MKKRIAVLLVTTFVLTSCLAANVKATEWSASTNQKQAAAILEKAPTNPDFMEHDIWADITESIKEEDYFCKKEIASGDEDIEIGGYFRIPEHWEYFKVTSVNDDDSLSVLSMNETFNLHLRISDQTVRTTDEASNADEPSILKEAENMEVTVSVGHGWQSAEKLRLIVYIEYGNGSKITYADDFAVYNPKHLFPELNQTERHVPTFSGKFFDGFIECDFFESEEYVYPLGEGRTIDFVIPFQITEVYDEMANGVMLTPDGYIGDPRSAYDAEEKNYGDDWDHTPYDNVCEPNWCEEERRKMEKEGSAMCD